MPSKILRAKHYQKAVDKCQDSCPGELEGMLGSIHICLDTHSAPDSPYKTECRYRKDLINDKVYKCDKPHKSF